MVSAQRRQARSGSCCRGGTPLPLLAELTLVLGALVPQLEGVPRAQVPERAGPKLLLLLLLLGLDRRHLL